MNRVVAVVAMDNQRVKESRIGKLGVILLSICVSIPIIPMVSQNTSATYIQNEQQCIDSPHNYPNQFDKSYIINRPGAAQIRILFEKIDIETNCDYIYVKSQSGVTYDTYTGYLTNQITSWIPGSKAIVRFITDSAGTDWGFRIKETSCQYSATIESLHPYQPRMNYYWDIVAKNASKIQLYFEKIELEQYCDCLWLYDPWGNLRWTTSSSGNWIYSSWVPGSRVRLQLHTDNSIQYYGFKLSAVLTNYNDDDNKFEVDLLYVSDYKRECTDLGTHPSTSIAYFRNRAVISGYLINQDESNSDVTTGDFGEDNSDLIIFAGHGWDGFVALEYYNDKWKSVATRIFDHNDADGMNIGNGDTEWYIFISCGVLGDSETELKEFLHDGAHAFFGYYKETTFYKSVYNDFFEYCYRGYSLYDAWLWANFQNGFPCWGAGYFGRISAVNDHLHGMGYVSDDSTSNQYNWCPLT